MKATSVCIMCKGTKTPGYVCVMCNGTGLDRRRKDRRSPSPDADLLKEACEIISLCVGYPTEMIEGQRRATTFLARVKETR